MKEGSRQAFLSGLSREARSQMERALAMEPPEELFAPADDFEGWKRIQNAIEKRAALACGRCLQAYKPRVETLEVAGMEALLIEAGSENAESRPAVFLHGGAYTGFSARSTLFASVPLAVELERPIISLDYPLAPHSHFDQTVPATAAAVSTICSTHGASALIGDSAGGGLALAVTSLLLQDGARPPPALVLFSPWTELGKEGDSRVTLSNHDPLLTDYAPLQRSAEAYAGGALLHPHASPVYADYHADFPRTLILCGSREILLSDSIRLYQRMKAGAVDVALDVHDGLYHSFPTVTPSTPEAKRAKQHVKGFLNTSVEVS